MAAGVLRPHQFDPLDRQLDVGGQRDLMTTIREKTQWAITALL